MRVLVTGSRNWARYDIIKRAMADAVRGQTLGIAPTLVHGGARGADKMADLAARELGWHVEIHPADWIRHRHEAGPVRNTEMVNAGADIALAFFAPCQKPSHTLEDPHPSHGAQDCADKAERANIDIRYHYSEGLRP